MRDILFDPSPAKNTDSKEVNASSISFSNRLSSVGKIGTRTRPMLSPFTKKPLKMYKCGDIPVYADLQNRGVWPVFEDA